MLVTSAEAHVTWGDVGGLVGSPNLRGSKGPQYYTRGYEGGPPGEAKILVARYACTQTTIGPKGAQECPRDWPRGEIMPRRMTWNCAGRMRDPPLTCFTWENGTRLENGDPCSWDSSSVYRECRIRWTYWGPSSFEGFCKLRCTSPSNTNQLEECTFFQPLCTQFPSSVHTERKSGDGTRIHMRDRPNQTRLA